MEPSNSVQIEAHRTKRLKIETNGSEMETVGSSSNGSGNFTSFFDFEKHQSSFVLKEGEIWAVRDEFGMPRHYALVKKDGDVHSAKVKYLKAFNDYDRVACAWGIFSCGNQELLAIPSFSHKVVKWEKKDYGYCIYLKKGDVWAIRTDSSTTLFGYDGAPTFLKYQMVEVLQDYDELMGIKLVYLVSVKGQNGNCFRRYKSEFKVEPDEALNEFSHPVPYIRIPGEKPVDDLLELDPSSLPLYVDDFETTVEPEINDNYLFLGYLDRKACDHSENGYIWAAYDHECQVPQKYVALQSKRPDHNTELVMHELVSIPIYNNEKKWHEAGFPLACGKFFVAPEETEKHFILSHRLYRLTTNYGKIGLRDVSYIDIYPKKGEIWGIYKDHNTVTARYPEGALDYQIVVVAERTEKDIKVAHLSRVEGFKGLFKKRSDIASEVEFLIPLNEFYRFSHKIPSYGFDENFHKEFLKGAYVLDPFMVPQNHGESYSFTDPFLLERSKVRPSWAAIRYSVNKQRNPISVASQENSCKESENSIINLSVEQEETVVEILQKGGKNIGEVSSPNVRASERMECEAVEHDAIHHVKLHNFDDTKSERNFEPGEIWAFFNGLNGLPLSYARIDKFLNSGGMLEVTLLHPHPVADEEMQWVDANLPMACGTFRASQSSYIEIKVLSHKVICEQPSKLFFRVYPREGEVWAVYNHWNFNWTVSNVNNNVQYKLVEIVSDFTQEGGVTVAALVRAEGHENVFRRQSHEGFSLFMTLKRKELLKFSHLIPSLKMTGDQDGLVRVKFSHNGIIS